MRTLRLLLLAVVGTLLCHAAPFQIKTMDDFWAFYYIVSTAQDDVYVQDVELLTDLDFSAQQLDTPIGYKGGESDDKIWSGTFEGNGHVVKNLVQQNGQAGGLFCFIKNATIKNLVFDESCAISAVHAAAVAMNAFDFELENIVNHGTIKGQSSDLDGLAGGLVATGLEGKLVSCVNNGTVSSTEQAGGLLCYAANMTFQKCSNHGTVLAVTEYYYSVTAGGFVGISDGHVVVESCENNGEVGSFSTRTFATSTSGGFIGAVLQGSLSFINSINRGNITSQLKYESYSAGFVGTYSGSEERGTVSFYNCHNFGTIDSISTELAQSGGFLGTIYKATVLLDKCSNNGAVSAESYQYEFAVSSSTSASMDNTIIEVRNFMNTADITSDGNWAYACGILGIFFEWSDKNHYTIYNSVNKGNIKAIGTESRAFGLAYVVHQVDNVVSMGSVEAKSKNQLWLDEFFQEESEYQEVNYTNVYQLQDNCTITTNGFIEEGGMYKDCNTGRNVVEALNAQAQKMDDGASWLNNLGLDLPLLQSLQPSSSTMSTVSWAILCLVAAALPWHL